MPAEDLDQTLFPQHERTACNAVDRARRVRRHTEEPDRPHPARCYAPPPMLKPIADLPDGILGFEASGEIQASDYRDTLMPAVRDVWERGDEIRIVLVFERWDGMSSGAAWEDLKVGMKNLTKWKRIALVTDLDWMITVTSLFGWMTPGELKRFPVAGRDQAIAWAAGDG